MNTVQNKVWRLLEHVKDYYEQRSIKLYRARELAARMSLEWL